MAGKSQEPVVLAAIEALIKALSDWDAPDDKMTRAREDMLGRLSAVRDYFVATS